VPSRFLFERLISPGYSVEQSDLHQAIKEQIQRSLNTSIGSFSDDRLDIFDHGVQSITQIGAGESKGVTALCHRLEAMIGQWEPRLQECRVTPMETDDPMQPIRLSVTGQVVVDSGRDAFGFSMQWRGR